MHSRAAPSDPDTQKTIDWYGCWYDGAVALSDGIDFRETRSMQASPSEN
jgi:hypothetical protein